MVFGQPAQNKCFYQTSPMNDADPVKEFVILQYHQLQKVSHVDALALVHKVFVPAVEEVIDRLVGDPPKNNDDGVIRTVFTLLPPFYNQHRETLFQDYHVYTN
jgi:hypothetical protein